MKNQRERLYGAMVACTSANGYRNTTVADLLRVAGVSRTTFYEHFSDKAECFRAANEALLDAALSLLRSSVGGEGGPLERAEAALDALLRLCVRQPAAARMCLVESYSAGPGGLESVSRALKQGCELVHEVLRQVPGHERTSPELARAVVGGLHRVLYKHLDRGEEGKLSENCPELLRWATGYPPPAGLPKRRRRRAEELTPPDFPGRDRHERIIRSYAVTVSRTGFPGASVPQIAADAGISNGTFYQHFTDKEDALLAALDLSGAQLVASALPAARRAPDWPVALSRALEALCDFLASEPAFARLRAVEVYAAGPEAMAHRDRAWDLILEELIPPSILKGPEPGPLTLDASSGAIYALVYDAVRKADLERLRDLPPMLTYIMLTPFIGPDEAVAVAAATQPHQPRPKPPHPTAGRARD